MHNPDIKNIAPYYRLVESYCNENDRVWHITLLNIGFWPDASRAQKDKVVDHLNARYKNELALFKEPDQHVLKWVLFSTYVYTFLPPGRHISEEKIRRFL